MTSNNGDVGQCCWCPWHYRNYSLQIFNLIVGPIQFKEKIITYVKNEKYNLNIMITTLKLVISCEIWGL